MSKSICKVRKVEKFATRPNITLFKPVSFNIPIDGGQQQKMANVEFSSIVK